MFGSNKHNSNPFGSHSYGLSPNDQQFFMNSARESADTVRQMLPDAMQVVKLAAGFLGVLAIGCAVIDKSSQRRD